MKVAIVGAGWAGMAAAVECAAAGLDVTVFEAAPAPGGRARALPVLLPDGTTLTLDNGQHILIGAYRDTLGLMDRVGVKLQDTLLALPLSLPYPDGTGLQTPAWAGRWPAPLDAVAAILTAHGWNWADRLALIGASLRWRRSGFECHPALTVAQLCADLPARVREELIEPLCVSALNTAADQASAQVFLHVMRDALFGQGHGRFGASHLLLPRVDLSTAFPKAALQWLAAHHASRFRLHTGHHAEGLEPHDRGWLVHTRHQGLPRPWAFDQVVLATGSGPAAQLVTDAAGRSLACARSGLATQLNGWAGAAAKLRHTAITTVYAWGLGARLQRPMLALRANPDAQQAPAQFVFDRGQLQPHEIRAQGVLAFVISDSQGSREALQGQVLQQAAQQLNLGGLQPLQTVVEKRATFACTPGLVRPDRRIAPGLWAAGDHVQGPYPATLEGAVRSGLAAAHAIVQGH
ncbi:MAG: hydroxysqualene dehydroxylase HpnE [Hydrogenophaga sp.]|jgi:squalene-associated FAD-dependent desaturase|nr:hydroxysqualene dehydroxylase HpnE [Hydrogenophaga sp.]